MTNMNTQEAWFPMYADAFNGLIELRGRIHRGKAIAANHSTSTIRDICRLAMDFDAVNTHGEPVDTPPALYVDQIADYALGKALPVFDAIQSRTDFVRVMVSGGMLEEGVVLHG